MFRRTGRGSLAPVGPHHPLRLDWHPDREVRAMDEADGIFLGKAAEPQFLHLRLANRHGLVTGATGTGKTVTLQVLAEGFSNAGVPVFVTDIKGDLSGIAAEGDRKSTRLNSSH